MDNKLLRLTLVIVISLINLDMSSGQSSASMRETEDGRIADYVTQNASLEAETNPESRNWDLQKVSVPEAWQIVKGAKNIVVAVLDTGIDDSHPDLLGKVIDRVNFSGDTMGENVNYHGTFVAGIISGLGKNEGRTGVAYNCSLLDVKVADNDGVTNAQKVAQGIIWAADHKAQVINISIVINRDHPMLKYAVNYAWKKGCVIVSAAGNDFSSNPVYPAVYPHVIGVAATDADDCLTRWTNRGDWVKAAAPGENIYSTVPGGGYESKKGSSFSAALVAGEAALIYAQLSAADSETNINDKIYNTVINSGIDISITEDAAKRIPAKRINVYEAARSYETQGFTGR